MKTAAELEDEVTKLAHTLDLEQVADVDIDKGLELIEEVHKYLEQMDFGSCKRCIAVLGTTGVGKSTLVSLLFGEGRLLVHHENEYSRVLVAEKPLPGVDIHSGSSSKTLLPGMIRTRIDDEDVVVFDMPGSHDTRGPFAELVVHSILKWMLAKHEQLNFLLVATPPHERPQGIGLANTINRVYDGSSNAVLVYMKCDADFEPGSTAILEGIDADKRKIPAFALLKPAKSDREGLDYSLKYQVAKRVILNQLVVPVSSVDVFEGSVPESAQLLLQNFCKRSIGKARHAISQEVLRVYRRGRLRRSFDEISVLLDALASQQGLDFAAVAQFFELMLPRFFRIRNLNLVSKAAKRLQLMERWTGRSLVLCKEEWLTEECRNILKDAESSLITLKEQVCNYREVLKKRDTKTMVIRAWHLHLSAEDVADIEDFVRMMHTPKVPGLPSIVLVGSSRVTIDLSLRVWANVIIVSPIVRISPTGIDLSAEGKAPACIPSRAGPGEDGVHGRPGLYGGNLVVVCKKLENFLDLFTSTGQQGGAGQDAGHGVNGRGAVYDVSQFKASAEKLIKSLTSLEKWEAAVLPIGIELVKCSKVELPPNNRNVVRAAVGAAMASASVAMGPEAAVVGCALGGGLLTIAFGRNTKTELKMVRRSVPGSSGVPPGCRGRGGHGGLGGEFYVLESGNKPLKRQGESGCDGEPGATGKHSRDGKASIAVRGTIVQEYNWCGQRCGKSSIKVREETPQPPRELRQNAFTAGERAAPTRNPLAPIDTAKAHYEEAFTQLVEPFPLCNFADIAMP